MTITKQSILLVVLLVFLLTACENSNGTKSNEHQTISVDTIITESIEDTDTLTYNYSTFPIDSLFSAKVLTVGTFHSDEVWDNADKGKWFGLFKKNTRFYITETKLKLKRVHDGIVDANESEKTGWEIQTENKDAAIILIERLNFLTARNVQQAILSKDQIFPGDTIQISYLGIDYKIFATGDKKKVQEDSELFTILDYKLYITAIINGKNQKSLLVAQPDFDDQMINLIFAGDIDGDGILDLIIDTSRHYNVTSPTLYLSKPANDKEVVKLIGGHTSVGC